MLSPYYRHILVILQQYGLLSHFLAYSSAVFLYFLAILKQQSIFLLHFHSISISDTHKVKIEAVQFSITFFGVLQSEKEDVNLFFLKKNVNFFCISGFR